MGCVSLLHEAVAPLALSRRQAAVAHLVLPAAMEARQLPGDAHLRSSGGEIIKPAGFGLVWQLVEMLEGGNGQWDSVHSGAARLMCADVQSVVVCAALHRSCYGARMDCFHTGAWRA